MYCEKFGDENNSAIVFLHGANFVHAFGKQYSLSDRYYLVVPHLMGYGKETERIFDAEEQTRELAEFIAGFGRKVTLVGFSLGAQLAVKLVAERPELFNAAVFVSPWLTKYEPLFSKALQENEKQFKMFKNKGICRFIGLVNGLPKEQRREFVEQIQNLKIETVRNAIDNKITFETLKGFENVSIPMIALAGGKEPKEVAEGLNKLAELNPNCNSMIWEKAAHNIPPVFYKKFNELLCELIEKNK